MVLRCGRQEIRSRVVKKSLSPFWDETLRLCIPSKTEPLRLEVWDKDAVSDDFLGQISLDLTALQVGVPQRVTAALQPKDKGQMTARSLAEAANSNSNSNSNSNNNNNNNSAQQTSGGKKKKLKKKKGRGTVHLKLTLQELVH